jgi:hypothetical protein
MAYTHKEIPFSGKLITAEPASIGQNFRTLTNMRYTDTHLKGIAGMTKINSNIIDATCYKTRSAFHFNKSQPQESHVLVQAYTNTFSASQVRDNTAVVPAAGEFSATALWTDNVGAGVGRFSNAPDGQIIYANGVDTCIWGGNEHKTGAVVQITTALSALADVPAGPKDVTDKMNNTKTDADNVMAVAGSYLTFLVGASRPAKGAKFYVLSANASANTVVVKESTDGVWTGLTITSDGTRTGGTTSFAQTGTISWASTVATTKPHYIEGVYAYWYQFTVDACSATISHITLDLPFQPILDMWDGVYRDIESCLLLNSTYTDVSVNVLKEDFDINVLSTFVN